MEENSVHAVIANHMLYHVPDREKAYSEIVRVLQPDGTLYAATNSLPEAAPLVDYVQSYKDFDEVTSTHFRDYVEQLIDRAGAIQIKTKSGMFVARL